MGKMKQLKARELCWEYEGRGHLMGSFDTTHMKAFFDDRFLFKKMYALYGCTSFEELARYLTKITSICGADKMPPEIVEDMIADEVENLSEGIRREVNEVWDICLYKYKWKSFERKFVTAQDIYDQYTDQSEDAYEWYHTTTGRSTQVLPVYQGDYFNVYETYVSYSFYNTINVTKFAVIVPTIITSLEK